MVQNVLFTTDLQGVSKKVVNGNFRAEILLICLLKSLDKTLKFYKSSPTVYMTLSKIYNLQ